jgi:TatD DNase family protein
MNLPQPGDYIDMHTHSGKPETGVFIIESLMAHEEKLPGDEEGVAYTFGIHPWFLDEETCKQQIRNVENSVVHPNVIAIGEAGFDRLRGPSPDLQLEVFEMQVAIAEELRKPLIIHCVRAWDELLATQKRLRPRTKWMIHGFRGSPEHAVQLLSKGFYLSIWFNFAIRSESETLLRSLPKDKFFLETDGAETDIKEIYRKVAVDLGISEDDLKSLMLDNYYNFFEINM